MESRAVQQQHSAYDDDQQHRANDGGCPADGFSPICHIPELDCACLKCLAQCDEELRCPDASDRIEISSDVEPHRPDGSVVAQTNSDGVGVIVHELRKVDAPVDVAAVIEYDATEVVDDGNGITQLGIQNE